MIAYSCCTRPSKYIYWWMNTTYICSKQLREISAKETENKTHTERYIERERERERVSRRKTAKHRIYRRLFDIIFRDLAGEWVNSAIIHFHLWIFNWVNWPLVSRFDFTYICYFVFINFSLHSIRTFICFSFEWWNCQDLSRQRFKPFSLFTECEQTHANAVHLGVYTKRFVIDEASDCGLRAVVKMPVGRFHDRVGWRWCCRDRMRNEWINNVANEIAR